MSKWKGPKKKKTSKKWWIKWNCTPPINNIGNAVTIKYEFLFLKLTHKNSWGWNDYCLPAIR